MYTTAMAAETIIDSVLLMSRMTASVEPVEGRYHGRLKLLWGVKMGKAFY